FMILHNMFNYHEEERGILEANNMISLDFTWNPARRWKVYGQFSLDQIQLSSEVKDYGDHIGYVDPNAFAGLLNASYTDVVEDGILTLYGEAVAVWPGMYLNEKYYDKDGFVTQLVKADNLGPCWSQDWLLGYKRTEEKANDMAFSGYLYGPDCLAFSLGGTYDRADIYSFGGSVLYLAHGEKGTGKDKGNYDFSGISSKETYNRLPLLGEKVEHTLVLSMEGKYYAMPWLRVDGGFSFVHKENYRFVEGKSFNDLQFSLGFHLLYW
ncbi:MAG: hypothetical protein KBS81_01060, partial [Spirochaetales bacterium]|nr:hypothetical protein [Candidatus Physcosoma equi]